MSEWQPISTVPHDRPVVLWCCGISRHWMPDPLPYQGSVAMWDDDEGEFIDGDGSRVKMPTYWRELESDPCLAAKKDSE